MSWCGLLCRVGEPPTYVVVVLTEPWWRSVALDRCGRVGDRVPHLGCRAGAERCDRFQAELVGELDAVGDVPDLAGRNPRCRQASCPGVDGILGEARFELRDKRCTVRDSPGIRGKA